jgi:hypothetical protein
MTDAAHRQAIITFENDLERAIADLEVAVAGIVSDVDVDNILVDGDGDPDDILVESSDGVIHLANMSGLGDLLSRLVGAPEEIASAFKNYDWAVRRALKTLQQALTREMAEGA